MALEDVMTSRTALQGFIPVPVATKLIVEATTGESFLSQLDVRKMTGSVEKEVTLDGVISAGWVGVDAGEKPVGKIGSIERTLRAEEVAVILAISDNTLRDTNGDVVEAIKREGGKGIRYTVEKTLLYGGYTDYVKPAAFQDGIVKAAIAAGNVLQRGSIAGGDIADEVSGTMSLVEADGFTVTNFAVDGTLKGVLRNARDGQGGFLYQQSMLEGTPDRLYGVRTPTIDSEVWNGSKALLLAFDKRRIDVGIWTTMEFKVSTDGTLVLPDGSIFSAFQRDSTLIRINMRMGYAIRDKVVGGVTKYPAAVLTPAA